MSANQALEQKTRVFGYVLNKQSGRGIRQLVVALYEWDLRHLQQTADRFQFDPEALKQFTTILLGIKQSAAPGSPLESEADYQQRFESFLTTAWEEEYKRRAESDGATLDPLWMLGERVGSTLTDDSGQFEFLFDATRFAHGDAPLNRPDLILIVFAPEDSLAWTQRSNEGQETVEVRPTSASPVSRILHISALGRGNAGLSEAYVIRLHPAQLQRYDIGGTEADFFDTLDDEKTAERQLPRRIRDQALKRVDRAKALKQRAADVFDDLSAVPRHLRQSDFFVLPGDRPGRLEEAQLRSRAKGVEWYLEPYAERASMVLTLSEEDLTTLRIDPRRLEEATAAAPATAQISHTTLCSLIQSKLGSTELVAVHQLLEEEAYQAGLRKRIEELKAPTLSAGPEPPPSEAAEPVLSPEEQIKKLTLERVERMSADGNGEGRTDPLASLQKALDLLASTLGPADVTSVHDFSNLQIAFPEVWTEAFDGELREAAEELFGEWMAYHDAPPSELHPEPDAFDDLRSFEEFMTKLGRDLEEYNHYPVPSSLVNLVGGRVSDLQVKYNLLSLSQRHALKDKVEKSAAVILLFGVEGDVVSRELERLRKEVIQILSNPEGTYHRTQKLLAEIGLRLHEPHSFRVFAPGTYNFGILATYRQEWKPDKDPYQVGSLAATIPLAPGEKRSYTKKETRKKSRTEKEFEKSQTTRSDEFNSTTRADAEIMKKVATQNNFETSAEGNFNWGIGSLTTRTSFSRDKSTESSQIKKSFHEAVRKAAQEFKDERSLEVTLTDEIGLETTTTTEISNPNNEVTVTYMLYELERRYRLTERLYRLTPVILVAQEVPRPDEIDEDWLLAHEWILRRVLLDDSFHTALDYLTNGLVSNSAALEVKLKRMDEQQQLVDDLKEFIDVTAEEEEAIERELLKKIADLDRARRKKHGHRGVRRKRAIRSASAEKQETEAELEVVTEELEDLKQRLSNARSSLDQATREYTEALQEELDQRTRLNQLRIHIKQNILYYMQAIREHEPPDQRFFRLYDLKVKIPVPELETVSISIWPVVAPDIIRDSLRVPGDRYGLRLPAPSRGVEAEERRLHDVADLDHPIGYKGNYIIFPLKECTYITDFMMQEYVDDYFGVRDPDVDGQFTTEELMTLAERIWHTITPTEREALEELVLRRLTSPRREDELIVVPTGELFMDAIIGSQALLERFKELHRAMDVLKVQEEVRQAELENLRRAARIIADEREDPEIEKVVRVEGASSVVVDTE